MHSTISATAKEKISDFIWQHLLLLMSLFLMTLGVSLCVRSCMGSSVISSIPMAFSVAGEEGSVPNLTIGQYTYIMNFMLVGAQLLILRRKFEPVQFFQLIIGFVFGALIDLNMQLTSLLAYDTLPVQIAAQFAGCTVMAIGIATEIRCGSVTMPGEGIQVAVCRVTGWPFPKVKIMIDTTLVVLAVVSCYCFFGKWIWSVVGPGTLFAMFYIGYTVKLLNPHMGWFDRLLDNRPGFQRYIYGLARFIYPRNRHEH